MVAFVHNEGTWASFKYPVYLLFYHWRKDRFFSNCENKGEFTSECRFKRRFVSLSLRLARMPNMGSILIGGMDRKLYSHPIVMNAIGCDYNRRPQPPIEPTPKSINDDFGFASAHLPKQSTSLFFPKF
jgi:hypothetical protein